jgi:hypothetical protein
MTIMENADDIRAAAKPSNLDMLVALATEIRTRYAAMSDTCCVAWAERDPETDADTDAMRAIAYAVEHMVELRAASIEELAVKAGNLRARHRAGRPN